MSIWSDSTLTLPSSIVIVATVPSLSWVTSAMPEPYGRSYGMKRSLPRSSAAAKERTAMAVTSSRPRSLAGSMAPAAVTG